MRMFILSSQCCEVFDRDVMNVIIQKFLNSCNCGTVFASRSRAIKLVVLFNRWFMPYKVTRGRQSFQCGTTKMPKAPKV